MKEGNTGYCPTTEAARQRHNGIMAALEMNHGGYDSNVAIDYNGTGLKSLKYGQTEEPVDIIPKTLWYSCMFGQNTSPGTEILENKVPAEHTAGGYRKVDDHTSIAEKPNQ